MNLTLEGYKASSADQSDVQFIAFNQDSTSISIGTKNGFQLYSLSNCLEKLLKTYQDFENKDICIVERLYSSSLVVIASLLSPRKLRLLHIRRKTEINTFSYINTILAVRLNRKRLIICLEDQLYVHNLEDELKQQWVIKNIPANSHGLCALSPNEDRCFLAYPASQHNGEVQIFDTILLRNKILIPAHDNPLAALAFDSHATLLASASEKGTVIRVHNVDDGKCLYEFRRGYARCVTIYSLAFSSDSQFLAATSNTQTVHVFKLEPKDVKDDDPTAATSWTSFLTKAVIQSTAYLSSSVNDMLNQWRSFATCQLPFDDTRSVCTIATIEKQPRVLVLSSEGYLYIYNLDSKEGGECTLIKQHRIEDEDSESESTGPPNQDLCAT